jgi:hypothetical protein
MHYDEEFQHHHGMCSHGRRHMHIAFRVGIGIVTGIGFALLLGWAVMLLWNVIMPELVHAARIGYWQSVGLIVLSRILVGGFHRGHGHGRHWGHARRHECGERLRAEGERCFREPEVKTAEGK